MQLNVGDNDRTIRIIGGVLTLSLLFFLPGNVRWLGLLGLVPLATGLFRWCPIYRALGISTRPAHKTRG